MNPDKFPGYTVLPGTIQPSVVGHLPQDISRFTHYLIIHGEGVSYNVIDTRHRRSPLVQHDLEIPVRVTVTMELEENNVQVTKRYEELVNER